ncbi:hypothetical protein MXB_395 [Myxobolus squamalis]|nr:hypothetical protein MXB_395 [Myxobolus squamalis]
MRKYILFYQFFNYHILCMHNIRFHFILWRAEIEPPSKLLRSGPNNSCNPNNFHDYSIFDVSVSSYICERSSFTKLIY